SGLSITLHFGQRRLVILFVLRAPGADFESVDALQSSRADAIDPAVKVLKSLLAPRLIFRQNGFGVDFVRARISRAEISEIERFSIDNRGVIIEPHFQCR